MASPHDKAALRAELRKIGRRLKDARRDADLTQKDIAIRLGVSPQLSNHWEKGKAQMSSLQARQVAATVGVTIDYLLTGLIGAPARHGVKIKSPNARLIPFATKEEMLKIAQGALTYDDIADKRATYAKCSDESLMFEVWDRAMEPSFLMETIISVDRQQRPEPGDCVLVALLSSNEILFRRYRPSPESKPGEPPYTLRAENPDFEARLIAKSAKPFFLGTKIAHARIGAR